MNGTHRSRGIFIAHGPGMEESGTSETSAWAPPLPWPGRLSEVADTIAAGLGLAPGTDATPTHGDRPGRTDYSEEEDAMVAERLRALGYLE